MFHILTVYKRWGGEYNKFPLLSKINKWWKKEKFLRLPSRLRLYNTQTESLQRAKTSLMSVLAITLWRGMLPRGKRRSIPLPYGVWINRPQGLTTRAVKMKAKATCTPWPIIGWTRKGMQVTLVAWLEEIEEEEKAKWLARPFSAKMIHFRPRKFGRESLVWGQKSANKDVGLQPKAQGGPVKSIEQNLWTEVSRKVDSADSGGGVTRL